MGLAKPSLLQTMNQIVAQAWHQHQQSQIVLNLTGHERLLNFAKIKRKKC